MKDFLKIFFILCGFVGAFLYGRNYGEQTFKQSEEYLQFIKAKDDQAFLKNDIENAKAKLQNILDSAENKKSDELLTQILQILKENLNVAVNSIEKNKSMAMEYTGANKPEAAEEPKPKLSKAFDYQKLKSYEWILMNAQGSEDVAGNLKNLEIKNMDSYMSEAVSTRPQDEALLAGSYRGRIMDVTNKEYGTFVFEILQSAEEGKDTFKGSITLFRNGRKESVNSFSGTSLGYRFESSAGTVINFGNTYYQMYKIPQTQQIAGFYYERLVNGTTKTIGSFVLNRVDQF